MNCLSQNTKSTSVHFTSLITKRTVYPILREESFMLGEKMDMLLKLSKTQLSRLANKYLCVTVIDYICKQGIFKQNSLATFSTSLTLYN